jgi:validoxylamine A glucosyltransferase
MPKISIIVPTYNRSQLLFRSLEAFRLQSLPASEFEVIIADDGSSDDTAAMVSSFRSDYELKYCFQEDLGHRAAAARNAGAKVATGEVLAFIDSGTIPCHDFALSHLTRHEGNAQGFKAVIGPVYGYSPEIRASDSYARLARSMSNEQMLDKIDQDTDPRYETFRSVSFDLGQLALPPILFWSGNISVRTSEFWRVGGFDENFREWSMEDTDLGYRLWDAGATFELCREGWAVELPHPRDDEANMKSLSRNIIYFLNKSDFGPPAREIIAMMVSVSPDVQFELEAHYRALLEWQISSHTISVAAEIERFIKTCHPGSRIGILGTGEFLPESMGMAVLFDFDAEFCQPLRRDGRAVRQSVGLRTHLKSGSLDSLLITSRMRGIWNRLGGAIETEARRVAADVQVGWHL